MILKFRRTISRRRTKRAVYAIRREAHKRGLDKMTLKDINALTQKVRAKRKGT